MIERHTITAEEAANYIGVSYWMLLEMVRKRQIPHFRVGRRVLLRKHSIDEWLNGQEESNYNHTSAEGNVKRFY